MTISYLIYKLFKENNLKPLQINLVQVVDSFDICQNHVNQECKIYGKLHLSVVLYRAFQISEMDDFLEKCTKI